MTGVVLMDLMNLLHLNNKVDRQNTRARKKGLKADLEVQQYIAILAFLNYKCCYCGRARC